MLKLPKQAPSQKLSSNKMAGVELPAGVRPAGWLDILKKAGVGALQGALS